MRRPDDTRPLQLITRRQSNGKVTRLLPLHFNRMLKSTRHVVLIWQRTRARRNSQLSTTSKADVSKAAKTGRAGIIGPSEITDRRGTTGVGGAIITIASFSYMVDGMLGTRAIGTRLGDTLPMRITPTMARFMPITACHP